MRHLHVPKVFALSVSFANNKRKSEQLECSIVSDGIKGLLSQNAISYSEKSAMN